MASAVTPFRRAGVPAAIGRFRWWLADRRALTTLAIAAVWLLATTTFSLPGRDVRALSEGFDWLAILKVGTRLCAAAMLIVGLLASAGREATRSAARALLPMAVFTGWCVVSAAWSPLPSVSAGQAFGLATLVTLSAAVAVAWHDERDTSCLLRHVSVALLVVSAALLVAHAVRPDLSGLAVDPLHEGSPGLFHPTAAGATASAGIVLVLAVRLLWDWRWARWLLPLALPIHVAVLLLATSRVALALAALVSLVAVLRLWRGRQPVVVLLVLATGAVLYPSVDPGLDRAGDAAAAVAGYLRRDQSEEALRSFTGRTELWPVMWASFTESPLRGHGYFVTSAEGEVDAWGGSGNLTAHNLLLQVLVSTGIIGMALFSVALSWLARSIAPLWRRGAPRALAWLLTLLAIWYAGAGCLGESFMGPVEPQSVLFFVALGLGLGEARSRAATAR